MATEIQKNLVEKNAEYAGSFTQGHLALPPAKKYLIRKLSLCRGRPSETHVDKQCPAAVTCMDARIDPAAAFGIALGDAHVIRNAGASAADALRSIIISEQLLGTNEIVLIKHTGCGMLTFDNSAAHGIVAQNLGAEAAAEIAKLDFRPFPVLEQAVRDDVAFLKASKAVPEKTAITGWVYEVETGKVKRVV
jgi:carbonic anhydrase